MNKAFEKILEFIDEQIKIEESIAKSKNEGRPITHQYGANCMNVIKKFVLEVAEEYNAGWIPCSERLPDDFMSMEYLTTVKGHFYPEINYYCVANHKWFSSGKSTKEVDVIAWQPLPEPFKERD